MKNRTTWTFLCLIALIGLAFATGCDCGDDDDDDCVGCDDDDDDSDDDAAQCEDLDGDGYGLNCAAGDDCNDNDPDAYQFLTGYLDSDSDGYPGTEVEVCTGDSLSAGYLNESSDCDDTHPMINPDGVELPDDGIDQDCDGTDFEASDSNGVFVDGVGGLDTNAGTQAAPVQTILQGILLAEAAKAGPNVYVAEGLYEEDVETSVSLFGGYEAAGWTRDILENTTEVQVFWNGVPVIANIDADVVIDGFTITGPSGMIDSAGVSLRTRSKVFLSRNTIYGGDSHEDAQGVMCASPTHLTLMENRIDAGHSGGAFSVYGVYLPSGTLRAYDNEITAGDSMNATVMGVYTTQATVEMRKLLVHLENAKTGYGVFTAGTMAVLSELDIAIDTLEGPGYGIFISSGSAEISDSAISLGESTTGSLAGIFSATASLRLSGSVVLVGDAKTTSFGVSVSGGGIANETTLINNAIVAGDAMNESTGFSLVGTSPTVVNNVLRGGSANLARGVRYIFSGAESGSQVFVNNDLGAGVGGTSSWGIELAGASNTAEILMFNNNIYGVSMDCLMHDGTDCIVNGSTVDGCAWKGCYSAGGTLSTLPVFVDVASGDFHLQSTSELIDRGVNPAPYVSEGLRDLVWVDFDGDLRPENGSWDIGADEYIP
jgi:Putative metal-binding motif/Protein of unknown function (DUF1565)